MSDRSIEAVEALVHRKFERLGIAPPEGRDAEIRVAGLTSLQMVELILFIEEQSGLRIPDEEFAPANFRTVRTIYQLLQRLPGPVS